MAKGKPKADNLFHKDDQVEHHEQKIQLLDLNLEQLNELIKALQFELQQVEEQIEKLRARDASREAHGRDEEACQRAHPETLGIPASAHDEKKAWVAKLVEGMQRRTRHQG
ncbi:hypothetical protein OQA88_6741 [Cercophora sp. LCS_1]